MMTLLAGKYISTFQDWRTGELESLHSLSYRHINLDITRIFMLKHTQNYTWIYTYTLR